jgi:hypothetical protein
MTNINQDNPLFYHVLGALPELEFQRMLTSYCPLGTWAGRNHNRPVARVGAVYCPEEEILLSIYTDHH